MPKSSFIPFSTIISSLQFSCGRASISETTVLDSEIVAPIKEATLVEILFFSKNQGYSARLSQVTSYLMALGHYS